MSAGWGISGYAWALMRPRSLLSLCLATAVVLPLLVGVTASPAAAKQTKVMEGFEVTLEKVVNRPDSVTVRVKIDGEVYRKLEVGDRFGPQRRFRLTAITLPPCAVFDYRHARARDSFALCVR